MREQAKTPESSFQRAYLRQKKREREQVRVFRALLLVSFLVLWEVAADLRWIDPFIFSSPVRVGKTFVTLLTEQNLLRHIGITVYETGISFLLVSALGMAFRCAFVALSALFCGDGAVPGSPEQPAEIGARPASHCVDGGKRENDHHGRHFRCDIRLGDQHLQQLSECGAGYAPPDCNTRRNEEGYAVPRRAAVVVSGAARRVEGQHRPVPRRCCNRRVYRGKRGAWLSDYLRQSGVQICTRKRREDDR